MANSGAGDVLPTSPREADLYFAQLISDGNTNCLLSAWDDMRKTGHKDPLMKVASYVSYARWQISNHNIESARVTMRTAEAASSCLGRLLEADFEVKDIRDALEITPEVRDGRFSPDASSPESFACECWVRCGNCDAPCVVWGDWLPDNPVHFTCTGCGAHADDQLLRYGQVTVTGSQRCSTCWTRINVKHDMKLTGSPVKEFRQRCPGCTTMNTLPVQANFTVGTRLSEPVDHTYGLKLLLVHNLSIGTVFAYNRHHLDQLQCYVAAPFRDESHNTSYSWSARLPAWIKAAKNRDKIMKALSRISTLADSNLP